MDGLKPDLSVRHDSGDHAEWESEVFVPFKSPPDPRYLILLTARSGSSWSGRGIVVFLRLVKGFIRMLFWGPEDLGRVGPRTRWDE
jgi:hypothetical protein